MRIIPGSSELTRPYWDAANDHRLVAQQCEDCGRLQHPPMPRCPGCHGERFTWRELGGRGRVYSYTVVHHPAHIALADRVPYVVGIVELDEGPRLVTSFLGDPTAVRIGDSVEVRFEQVADGVTLSVFEAVADCDAPGDPARSARPFLAN